MPFIALTLAFSFRWILRNFLLLIFLTRFSFRSWKKRSDRIFASSRRLEITSSSDNFCICRSSPDATSLSVSTPFFLRISSISSSNLFIGENVDVICPTDGSFRPGRGPSRIGNERVAASRFFFTKFCHLVTSREAWPYAASRSTFSAAGRSRGVSTGLPRVSICSSFRFNSPKLGISFNACTISPNVTLFSNRFWFASLCSSSSFSWTFSSCSTDVLRTTFRTVLTSRSCTTSGILSSLPSPSESQF
mmetsp:Transcript_6560/g.13204  ORF Transcript_6560/g.13204 Transcript_6560/m.13204 type:complete len:248 (+) Transcript_6560:2538-3281(+)